MTDNSKYFLAILWFIGSLTLDNLNDVIMKYVGQNIPPYEIIFFRFFFGSIILLPFYIRQQKEKKHTKKMMGIHFLRGGILFLGIVIWCQSLGYVNITTATSVNFVIPFYVLILAKLFLSENLGKIRILATIIGFAGTLVVIYNENMEINIYCIFLLFSALLFAILDILNKFFIKFESKVNLMFFSEVTVMFLSFIPTIYYWITPNYVDIFLLSILGVTGNLILLCLLNAFSLLEISTLAPFRYTEIIISTLLGYLVFSEVPTINTIIGAIVILSATMILTYEKLFKNLIYKKEDKKNIQQINHKESGCLGRW